MSDNKQEISIDTNQYKLNEFYWGDNPDNKYEFTFVGFDNEINGWSAPVVSKTTMQSMLEYQNSEKDWDCDTWELLPNGTIKVTDWQDNDNIRYIEPQTGDQYLKSVGFETLYIIDLGYVISQVS